MSIAPKPTEDARDGPYGNCIFMGEGAHCSHHGDERINPGNVRCETGNHILKDWENTISLEHLSWLTMNAREIFRQKIVEALQETSITYVEIGITRALQHEALREAYYEFTKPHWLTIKIDEIEDKIDEDTTTI
jgi:hypothetical protein